MTVNIIFEEPSLADKELELLKKAVHLVLEKNNRLDVDVTLIITDDKHIQQLNKDYRGISSPTDVLSFEQNFIDPETETFYLGDIIISIEQAQKQAHQAQHSLLSECALLAIHGTLHLLGFDHTSVEEEKAMWEEQNNLLAHFLSNLPERSK